MRILVVDDDPQFRRFTTLALEAAGYAYDVAADGEEGLARLRASDRGAFDAVLLDVEMPVASGWDLLASIRDAGDETPVLFLTGRADVQDRVAGLRLGADDYVLKPVEYEELIARIEAVVRRRASLPTVSWEDLHIDLATRTVRRAGSVVEFSPREFDLVLSLVQARGDVVSRETLLSEVWAMDFDPGTNLIDVHIGRVRKKLQRHGASLIETVRGRGYRMRSSAED